MLQHQYVCTSQVKTMNNLISSPERAGMLPRQHVCTIQQVKDILVDCENVKFWASQVGNFKNLRMLPWQHVQKSHIIDGPACTTECRLIPNTVEISSMYVNKSLYSKQYRKGCQVTFHCFWDKKCTLLQKSFHPIVYLSFTAEKVGEIQDE